MRGWPYLRNLTILSICTGLIHCTDEKDTTFLIGEDHVGKLTRDTRIGQLETLFSEDSVVQDPGLSTLGTRNRLIRIYEKGGNHMLTLHPASDSLDRIGNIRVHDPRYITERGINITSTFKDIESQYSIRKIITSTNNVVIFIKESDLYFTIDKDELPSSLRYASSTNIEAVQIPDKAKLKYLMVGWDQ